METIVNKIAQSGLITLDLESLLTEDFAVEVFDLKPFLFKEMILREKDFRQSVAEFDWSVYAKKKVAVFCSVEAIIPAWAYMLVAVHLAPYVSIAYTGVPEGFKEYCLLEAVKGLDISSYKDKKVILKGCGTELIPASVYLAMSLRLQPVVKSLMYGEACSTVPIYKLKSSIKQ